MQRGSHQQRFEALLPAALAAGAGAAWILRFAPVVRRPSYLPGVMPGEAAPDDGALDASRFFSEIEALAEPFRTVTRAAASSDCYKKSTASRTQDSMACFRRSAKPFARSSRK